MGDILKAIAPGIATALGGPLAGAAVSFLAGKFGTANTQAAVSKALEGFTADDMVKMKGLDDEFTEHMAELGVRLDQLQLGVNQAEAASTSMFVAGWRPAVGWTCGLAFAYTYVVLPLLQFGVYTFGTATMVAQLKGLPVLDIGTMMPVLFGMLGMGYMRTLDKQNGTSNGH